MATVRPLPLVQLFVEAGKVEGFHCAFVLRGPARDGMRKVFLPSKLLVASVPAARIEGGKRVEVGGDRVRRNLDALLTRLAQARRFGQALPRRRLWEAVVRSLGGTDEQIARVHATVPEQVAEARRAAEAAARIRRLERELSGGVVSEEEAAAIVAARVDYRLRVEPGLARAGRVAAEADRRDADSLGGVALPRPGTKCRVCIDLLLRPEGVDTAEMHASLDLAPGKSWGGAGRSAREAAEKYGLERVSLGGGRWALRPKAAGADAPLAIAAE